MVVGCWTIIYPAPDLVMHLASTDRGICGASFAESTLDFLGRLTKTTGVAEWERDNDPLLVRAADLFKDYFSGRRPIFDFPLDLRGSPFQLKIWAALRAIPYGERRTYAAVAEAAGSPRAVRAAGTACGANPVAIAVPCHRVVPSGRGIGHYGGGADVKRRLLALESGFDDGFSDQRQ
jgi:O-6-methylguanine DNA methyltransferase